MSRLLIVGESLPGHVAPMLRNAATSLGHQAVILDSNQAMGRRRWLQSPAWRLARRPLRLHQFCRRLLEIVDQFKPDLLISAGMAPVSAACLQVLHQRDIPTFNFSTDDPWNPAHRSQWFLKGVHLYTRIFSPRLAAIDDFQRAGAADVRWLPFGYSPDLHYPDPGGPVGGESDAVAFAGGADAERLSLLQPLLRSGVPLALWGGYWERHALTRPYAHGFANPDQLRRLLSNTPCALALVRRANRDGHAMRSLEVGAMAAPVLAEDTEEHRRIYGKEGEQVLYFASEQALVTKARWLLSNRQEGRAMGKRLNQAMVQGNNTYADRLKAMLATC